MFEETGSYITYTYEYIIYHIYQMKQSCIHPGIQIYYTSATLSGLS